MFVSYFITNLSSVVFVLGSFFFFSFERQKKVVAGHVRQVVVLVGLSIARLRWVVVVL